MPLLHVSDRLRTKWRNGKREHQHHHPSTGQKAKRLSAALSPDTMLHGIGNYVFLDALGRGKFSKVMLAQHTQTGENYAVKIIDKRSHDYRIISRLAREIDLMSSLNHPNIVRLYETYETADSLFLILEYVKGVNLDEHLLQNGHLEEEEARSIFRQIVGAVNYCHGRYIVHRDLKAPNVLLSPDGCVRLVDFGLGNRFGLQRLKTICGSMLYYSPEIITGQRYVGPEVDCWCLGILLYRMTTGYEPFGHARTVGELKQDVVNGNYPMPTHLSQELQATIRKCLNLDKRHRASVQQALHDDPWLNDHGRLLCPFTIDTPSPFINQQKQHDKIQNTIIYHPINPSAYFTGPSAPQSDVRKENFKDNEIMRIELYQRFKSMLDSMDLKPVIHPEVSSSLYYRLRSSPNLRTMCKRLVKDQLRYYTTGCDDCVSSVQILLRAACGFLGISYQCQSPTVLLCVLNLRNPSEGAAVTTTTAVPAAATATATDQDHPMSLPQQQARAGHHGSSVATSWTSRFKRLSHSQPIGSAASTQASSLGQPSSLMSTSPQQQQPSPLDRAGPQLDDAQLHRHRHHEEGTAVFTIEILVTSQKSTSNLVALRFSKISGSSKVFKLATGWVHGVLL